MSYIVNAWSCFIRNEKHHTATGISWMEHHGPITAGLATLALQLWLFFDCAGFPWDVLTPQLDDWCGDVAINYSRHLSRHRKSKQEVELGTSFPRELTRRHYLNGWSSWCWWEVFTMLWVEILSHYSKWSHGCRYWSWNSGIWTLDYWIISGHLWWPGDLGRSRPRSNWLTAPASAHPSTRVGLERRYLPQSDACSAVGVECSGLFRYVNDFHGMWVQWVSMIDVIPTHEVRCDFNSNMFL